MNINLPVESVVPLRVPPPAMEMVTDLLGAFNPSRVTVTVWLNAAPAGSALVLCWPVKPIRYGAGWQDVTEPIVVSENPGKQVQLDPLNVE